MIKVNKINNCRICNSKNLKRVLHFSKVPFTDEFVTNKNKGEEYIEDINIGQCTNCGSVQNLYNTDMNLYYNDYCYTVQSSSKAMDFMNILATETKKKYFSNKLNPSILEIGSGSGEQLQAFKNLGFSVIGIEPSQSLSDYANKNQINTITDFFNEESKKYFNELFDAVVTSYTFDHIPNVNSVLQEIYKVLKNNGIIIIEVHDLDLIIERNEYCLFEHEHYTYLNKETLTYLLNKNGFEVDRFDLLNEKDKRANSLLVVAKKSNQTLVHKIITENEFFKINNLQQNINNAINRIDIFLEKNQNKKIVAYGAGGRGVMTCAALKNHNYISFFVDKNPKGDNIFAPKTHIPVFNVEKLKQIRADIIIIFSFGYYQEIESELIRNFNYKKNQLVSLLQFIKI